MKKSRLLSSMLSAVLSVNLVLNSCLVSSCASSESSGSDNAQFIDERYIETEPSYDPLEEYRAAEEEKRMREAADIETGKIVFSVTDKCDIQNIAGPNGLTGLKKLCETENTAHSCIEIFYEAKTSSDDIWGVVYKLRENENVISAEPVFKWKPSADDEYSTVTDEEYEREIHFSVLDTRNVWSGLKYSRSR